MFDKIFKKNQNSSTPLPGATEKLTVSDLSPIGAGGFLSSTPSIGAVDSKLMDYYEGWVAANIDRIALAVSNIELKLYKVRTLAAGAELIEIEEHPALDLIDKFNDYTASDDGIYLTSSMQDIFGDCFWYVNPKAGIIYLIPSDKVKVYTSVDKNGATLITKYEYTDTIDGKNVKINYSPEEIVPFKNPNPKNPIRGLSRIETLLRTIQTDINAEEFNRRFFMNNATPDTVFSTDQKLNTDQIARIESEMKKRFRGVQNSHKTMIMSGGLTAASLNTSQRDMEFLKQQQWTRDKLMAGFGNTKASLGITDDVNRANAEASIYLWLKESIKPRMKRFVNALNEAFLPIVAPGEPLIFGFEDPYPEDTAEDLDLATKGYGKWVTRNEAREMFGLDPVDGGDEFAKEPDPNQMPPAPQLPAPVKNVSYVKHFRRIGIYKGIEKAKQAEVKKAMIKEVSGAIADASRDAAKALYSPPLKVVAKTDEVRESLHFTNKEVWKYHNEKIGKIEQIETRFEDRLLKFLNNMEIDVLKALENIQEKGLTKVANDPLFDQETMVKSGVDLFTPLFDEALLIGGMEALALLGEQQNYKPSMSAEKRIRTNVEKFTESMVSTDRDKLIDIIVNGFNQGNGVDQISSEIRSAFDTFRKNQVRTMVRTEILRAANAASVDVYQQSEVVVGKQWLTAEDSRTCSLCAPLNGKIVGKSKLFFKKGAVVEGTDGTAITLDYESISAPPLHVSCRCDVLPVLLDSKSATKDTIKELKARLKASEDERAAIEADVEKKAKRLERLRKKKDKELAEAKEYAAELEKLVDGGE